MSFAVNLPGWEPRPDPEFPQHPQWVFSEKGVPLIILAHAGTPGREDVSVRIVYEPDDPMGWSELARYLTWEGALAFALKFLGERSARYESWGQAFPGTTNT